MFRIFRQHRPQRVKAELRLTYLSSSETRSWWRTDFVVTPYSQWISKPVKQNMWNLHFVTVVIKTEVSKEPALTNGWLLLHHLFKDCQNQQGVFNSYGISVCFNPPNLRQLRVSPKTRQKLKTKQVRCTTSRVLVGIKFTMAGKENNWWDTTKEAFCQTAISLPS